MVGRSYKGMSGLADYSPESACVSVPAQLLDTCLRARAGLSFPSKTVGEALLAASLTQLS
jgi:hypothetical protein